MRPPNVMKALVLIMSLFAINLKGQSDSLSNVRLLYAKLSESRNYNKLNDYFCNDLHIDCACYVYDMTPRSGKTFSETIDFSCGDTAPLFSYTFILLVRQKRVLVYDNRTKRKMGLQKWDKLNLDIKKN